VSGLSFVAGPVGPGTDTTFVVRAFDTASGLEEANTRASVRVLTGPDGNDVGAPPNPPHALSVAAVSGGACRVSWAYAPSDVCGTPAGFHVYLTQGTPTGPPPPAATVAYAPGRVGYSVVLPGPYQPAVYTATVCGFNAAGEGAATPSPAAGLGLDATP